MQHVAIDVVRPKMFQRTGQRLRHLHRERGRRIVGKTMVLTRTWSSAGALGVLIGISMAGAVGQIIAAPRAGRRHRAL